MSCDVAAEVRSSALEVVLSVRGCSPQKNKVGEVNAEFAEKLATYIEKTPQLLKGLQYEPVSVLPLTAKHSYWPRDGAGHQLGPEHGLVVFLITS